MVQKITSILLLMLFLCNAAGFYNVYQFQKRKKEHNVSETHVRREDQLTVKVFDDSSLQAEGFQRIEEGEYRYNGHRYDVVRREQKIDHIRVELVHDSYEEELISFLKSFFKTRPNSHQQKRGASSIQKSIMKRFLATRPGGFHNQLILHHPIRLKNNAFPVSPYLEVTVPPPKQA
jgi:hypothetical protein